MSNLRVNQIGNVNGDVSIPTSSLQHVPNIPAIKQKVDDLSLDTSTVLVAGVEARAIRSIDGIKNLIPVANTVLSVTGFYAGTSVGGGDFIYNSARSWADHNGVTVISSMAITQWDGTLNGVSAFLNWTGSGSGCYVRVDADVNGEHLGLTDLSRADIQLTKAMGISVSDFGSTIGSNTYFLNAPFEYRSERKLSGKHYSFGGTILTPTGNHPIMVPKAGVSAFTRFGMEDMQFNCENHTTIYAMTFDEMYIAEFKNLWFRNSFKGIRITNSDSMSFHNVKWMETQRNTAITLGDNARSIKFLDCNFETSEALKGVGGVVELDGYGTTLTDAQFQGCQWERAGLLVNSGSATVLSGKFTDTWINLLTRSVNCDISGRFYGGSVVHDFGYNNIIRSVTTQNMAVDEHRWPYLKTTAPVTNNTPTFGDENNEMLYLVTIANKTTADLANGGIELKQGGSTLQSVSGKLIKRNLNSVGLGAKQCYTHMFAAKNTATITSVGATGGASLLAVCGGVNLLTNGTFSGNSVANWLTVNAAIAASSDQMVITPSGTSWGVYQNIDGVLKQGSKYIVVAKYTGNASLYLGDSWDGSTGLRPLSDVGVDLYGDGDRVAMLSFRYYRDLSNRISIGGIGSNTQVTVKYIMLIECPEYVVPKAADVPLQTTSSQTIGNLGSQGVYVAGSIPLAGVNVGDFCVASYSNPLLGCAVTAEVSAADTIKVSFINNTDASAALGTGTIRVLVFRK
jgi:hypothetical protein